MSENALKRNSNFSPELRDQHDLPDTKTILKKKPSSNADPVKIHEFTRENRVESYDQGVDHFAFTKEDDAKYDFLKPKSFF